jgi:hypothetical protein
MLCGHQKASDDRLGPPTYPDGGQRRRISTQTRRSAPIRSGIARLGTAAGARSDVGAQ